MQNIEQLEAYQAELNEKNSRFRASLVKEYQDKYAAIDSALEILNKAKVESYIFAYIPHWQSQGEEVMIQYNNLMEIADKKGGDPTPDAKTRLEKINQMFICSFINLCFYCIRNKEGKVITSFLELFSALGNIWNSNLDKIKQYKSEKF